MNITTIILSIITVHCFIASCGGIVYYIKNPNLDTKLGVGVHFLAFIAFALLAMNSIQKAIPEPAPTKNTNFNQLP